MTKNDAVERAVTAADEIITDLSDRRGLRQEWESIDSGVQQEIKEAWAQIIVEALQTSRPDAGSGEQLAQLFHETYERLAPSFGYETRKDSAKPWADVPDKNKRLMIAVGDEISTALKSGDKGRCVDRLRDLINIQSAPGSFDQNEYMRGLANGLLLALSVFDGNAPKYHPAQPTSEAI